MANIETEKRLAKVFKDFGQKFELDHTVDADGLGASLGVPNRNEIVEVGYVFHPSDDSYDFGAKLGSVPKHHVPSVATEILSSEPIRGITERIDSQGSVYVVGGRDNLKHVSETDIQKGLMDDVSRVSTARDQFRGIIDQAVKRKK